MADAPAQTPSTTPAQVPDYSFDTAKLKTTTGTQEELDRFKKELSIDEAKKDGEHKEVIKIQEFFEKNKEKIKKITQAELLQLKADIQDTNQDLPGELVVDQNGVVEYKEAQAQATVAPETPNTPSAVIEKTLGELNISADIPPIPNDYVSKNKPNMLESFIMNILDRFGLGFIANWLKMRTMGYKSEKQMEYTQKAMNTLLSVKESPISSIIRLDDITEREFRKILSDHGDLDLSIVENVEAALLGKHAKNPKYKKYHRIYRGIEVMAREISNTVTVEYKPVERLDKLLNSSKDEELDPDYSDPAPTPVHAEAPILTDAEKRAEEEKQKITELEGAEKADKELALAIEGNPTGDPKITEAQESVDAIKNKSKERILNAIKNAETERNTAKTELIVAQDDLKVATQRYDINKSTENEQKKNTAEEKVKETTQLQTNAEKAIQAITDIAKNLAGGTLPLKIENWAISSEKTASESLLGAQKSESEIKSIRELLGENKDAIKRENEEKEQGAANKLNPFTADNIIIYKNKPYQWTGTNEFREIHYKVGADEGKRIGRNSWWNTNDIVLDSEAIKNVKVLTFSDAEMVFHRGYMDKANKNGISIDNNGYIWIKNTEGLEFRDPK